MYVVYVVAGSTAEPLSSAYAAQFGSAFAAAPLGSVLGSAAAAAAGKQVEGNLLNLDLATSFNFR